MDDEQSVNPQQESASQQLTQKVRLLNEDLHSVHKTSQLFVGAQDLDQVLQLAVQVVAQAVRADAAGLRLLERDNNELALKATWGLSEEYINKGPVTAGESALNRRALNGEVILVDDMQKDEHFVRYHNEVAREGLVSCMTLGLLHKSKGIGTLRLYNKGQRAFSEADISTAQIVAAQSAMAIMNARLYAEALEGDRIARQVRMAGEVQRHLIPAEAPDIPGIDMSGIYVPCYDVGGDFYDFIDIRDGRFVVNIGDVMGKGVPASLAMASLRSSLRAYAAQFEDLKRYISRANQMFCHDNTLGEFATVFSCEIVPQEDHLHYCNCGHEPPILLRDGQVSELAAGGTIIGLSESANYTPQRLDLQSGDMILMYTDGLIDAVDFEREPYGRERLVGAFRDTAAMSAAAAARSVLWAMRKFTGLTRRFDDIALVVIKKT